MITPDDYLAALTKLPPLMKQLTKHHGLVDQAIALEDKYRLNGQQAKTMMNLEASIIAQDIQPGAVLDHVNREMGMDSATAKKFAVDFLGMICLPMQWYIGNVENIIQQLSGDLRTYQAQVATVFADLYGTAEDRGEEVPAATTSGGSVIEANEPPIVQHIAERLTTTKGRAEVLLRMTALSQEIETAASTNRIGQDVSQQLMHSLDALSYAVNTQDLNPLEIAAIKRRLKSVLAQFAAARKA